MNILYLSVLVSSTTHVKVRAKFSDIDDFAVQKFNRLVVEGLVSNGARVKALSVFFLPKGMWMHRPEQENGVNYIYIPSVALPLVRHIFIVFSCFFYVFFWGLFDRKNKTLMCDVLNVGACTGAVAAASILGLRRVGIMTDMPGLMVTVRGTKRGRRLFSSVIGIKNYLNKFTHYVFLTKQMNKINIHNRPYIIMEGLVSPDSILSRKQKTTPRTVFYAGGLHEKYGIRILIDAIKKLPMQDIQLVLYGDGPIVDELKKERDSRIVYKGLASNDVIVEEEQKATLLVNPRPTCEEFTKYSFPSKNMEYMVSGTPLLTTRLPGMPKDHWPFVYLIEDETIDGFACKLKEILSLSSEELEKKGADARKFVLANKTNTVQAARIIRLINQ